MIEKRFKLLGEVSLGELTVEGEYIDNKTGKKYGSLHQSVNLLNKLNNEIEELKKENMEYYHIINCGNCKYHNWDWYEDGDEFEICDKGQHERLMYHKFCEEWEEL